MKDYTPGQQGGLTLTSVTLVQHQSGRLWTVSSGAEEYELKVDSIATVTGGPKLAAARLDHNLVKRAGPTYMWVGQKEQG